MNRRKFIATGATAVVAATIPTAAQAAPKIASATPAAGPLWALLAGSVEPAHTVIATGGAPTWTAICMAIEAVEGHAHQKVRTIVIHPDMAPQLDAMNSGKMLDDNIFLMGGRVHQAIYCNETLPNGDIDYSKHSYGPIITVEQRSLQAIIDEAADKDTILLLCNIDKFTGIDPEVPIDCRVVNLNPMGMGKVVVTHG